MIPSWMRGIVNLADSTRTVRRRGRHRSTKAPIRPRLEQFEPRLVPTTIFMPDATGARGQLNVPVTINVDSLDSGLSGAGFAVAFENDTFTVSTSGGHVRLGSIFTGLTGWTIDASVQPYAANPSYSVLLGQITGNTPIASAGAGTLLEIDFNVNITAPPGAHIIDLSRTSDGFGGSTFTSVFDASFGPYVLAPEPQDGFDDTDSEFLVTGSNNAPVANNDSYVITTRGQVADPVLTVAAPGVLGNDTDADLEVLSAIKLSDPSHGLVSFNPDGSFTYTPSVGFVGPDSFTYKANDGQADSNIATVNLNVTPRVSIPVDLTATPGGTIVVPVNIDTPNPAGTGGLNGVILAINYDPLVLSVSATTGLGGDFQTGTITSGWNITPTVDAASGELGVTLSSGTPNTSTLGGSLVLITFDVLPGAPAGPTRINLMQQNTPLGIPVTTGLDTQNGQSLPPRPAASNADNDLYVDGLVYIGNHFSVVAPANVATGGSFNFTVTALDGANGTLAGYTGTVQFTSTDGAAVLPGPVTLTNGVGTFAATLNTPGTHILTATDAATSTFVGFSNPIAAAAAGTGATHFEVSASTSSATAGDTVSFTVTALTASNGVATGYTGTVHLTSSDAQAGLPADATLVNGVGVFNVTLKTAGNQTVTASDVSNSGITGTSGTVAVSAAAASQFTVSAPGSATAGTSIDVTVTALDQFNNTATGYTGTVAFTSTSGNVTLPGNSTLTGGTGTFGVTFKTVGNFTVTATDTTTSSINGTSGTIAVSPGAVDHFTVTGPAAVTAGASFNVTVTALDAFNNTATNYTGTVQFTSSDLAAGLPGEGTLTAGTRSFSVTLKTAGNQALTVNDKTAPTIVGTLFPITVNAAAAASFTVTATPSSITAGQSVDVTVTALDAFNNTATSYTGTVLFSTTNGNANLPSNGTLTGGTGTFNATLKATGSHTITATDSVSSGINGTSNTITVSPAATTHFSVTAPGSVTAGAPFNFTVTARDVFDNTATNYSGTVQFTTTDPSFTLPGPGTLTAGTGSFSATLNTLGSQTITAADTASAGINGTSNTITVAAAASVHFEVSAPTTAIAGVSFNFTVTALDGSNNTVTGYTGTVHFTSTDTGATLPVDVTLTAGTGTFSAALTQAGSQTITATDTVSSEINGTSGTIAVSAGAATQFVVSAPSLATAGTAFNVTVTALDAFSNTATGYAGTVQLTSTDPQASTLGGGTLTSGVGTFSVTLKTAGSQTITATDATTASIVGTSGTITVVAGAATQFAFSGVASSLTAGSGSTFTLSALDAFNNTATSYTGTVHFTSTDSNPTLPPDATLTAGTGLFPFTLKTAGSQTITATDLTTSSINGTSATITVLAGAATHFSVTAPGAATAGAVFNVTVTARDAFENTANGYTGTVNFTSTDPAATLPGPGTLTSGVGNFNVTLKTAGPQRVTATDTASSAINGTSGTITVNAAAAANFQVTALSSSVTAGNPVVVSVTARDAFNNTAANYSGTVQFTSSDLQADLPVNATLSSGTGNFVVTFKTAGGQTVTASDVTTPSISGLSNTVTVSAAGAASFSVDAPSAVTPGLPFNVTVTARDGFNNTATGYTGTVQFLSTDGAAVLPGNSTLTSGQGTFSVTLNTVGSQTVTARDVTTPSIVGTSGPITVGSAVVTQFGVTAPAVAIQGSAFSFTVSALDASNNVVASYSGTVQFTSSDLAAALPGPVTLTNGVGTFNATLNTLGNQTLTATDTASSGITGSANLRVPVTLSIPTNLSAARGATVTVPININALNDPVDGTSGLSGADILIAFPDNAFSVNVATGIHLGTVPLSGSGWTVSGSLAPGVDPSFTVLTLNLSTVSTPITATDGGSLVTVDFQVKPLAPFGTHTIDILATTNGVPPSTTIFDQNFSPYTVLPAPDDAVGAINPGVDGTFTVVGVNQPPLANPDNYLITMRTLAGDPILNIAAPGVLSNDNDPDLESLTAVKVSDPVNGILAFNADGSFTYTPNVGFIGQDSFTYKAVDPNLAESAVTTVTLNMTPRLSIPTNLTATPGGTIVVPVNIDTPNPAGTGGLNGVILAINYDPLVLSVSATTGLGGDFQTGTITSGWNITPTVDAASGELGVTLSSGTPNTSTLGGSLVLITFDVLPGAPAGPTRINLMQQNTPLGIPVTTGLDTQNGQSLPPRPAASNADNDLYVDGLVYIGNHFSVVAPANVATGGSFNFTVTALDGANGTLAGYTGTVQFTSTDGAAVLPGPVTLTNGVGTFAATLNTPGTHILTATDAATSTFVGFSNPIAAAAAGTGATHFEVSASTSSATAGDTVSFTVTALTASNGVATGYSGTVHLTSSDAQAGLPADATLVNGVGVFNVTLKTAGNQTVTASDVSNSGITGTSGTVAVSAAAASQFTVSAPGSATAGTSIDVTVTALDQFNNTATGYTGTVAFTSTSGNVTLPGNSTLTGGTGTFGVTFKTVGNFTVTATDTTTSSINGTSGTIAVSPGAVDHFTVTGPAAVTAGASFNVTVTALDAFNNTATNYTGTVQFTSSDLAAGLPGEGTLTSGTGSFSVTLKTAGNQALTVNDKTAPTIVGTLFPITVNAAAANHFTVTATPSSITAGQSVDVTVTALDAFNNTATSYTGTVLFSTTNGNANLPSNGTLTGGTGTFNATLKATGSHTITATDSVSSGINGTSNTITVSPAATTHFSVTAPGSVTAGAPFNFTVTARDVFDNTATNYSGTVQFTTTDPSFTLPGPGTLTAGTGSFSATLNTLGSQTITATDLTTSSINGTSNTITVAAAASVHFEVSAPTTAIAGVSFNFTVTALDGSNNTVTGYTGTVHFTSTDGGATLPVDVTLTAGTGTFSATLTQAGSQTITATDTVSSEINGTSGTIAVSAGAATQFVVSAPSSATAGTAFNVTVTALDAFSNTATGYAGTVQLTSTDPQASTLGGGTLTSGVGTFSVTLKTAGSQTITATDATTASINGTSNTITVVAGAATQFAFSGVASSLTAGSGSTFTLSALDAFNNTATSYTGTVHFTSTDSNPTLPLDATLTAGTGLFPFTLKTAGSQTITATDLTTSSINGTSATITVLAGAATHFSVVAPGAATAGAVFNVTVTARDAFENTANGYTGTVNFTSTDPAATLPGPGTLTSGVGNFNVTLKTAGPQRVTATDTASSAINGTSGTITVNAAAAANFQVTALSSSVTAGNPVVVSVTARDAFNNTAANYSGTVQFTSSDLQADLPVNATLSSGTGNFVVTFKTAGGQTVTASDVTTPSISGLSNTVTVSAAGAASFSVDAPSAVTPGLPFNVTVTARDGFNNTATGYTGTVQFLSTDGAAVLPGNSTLTSGQGTFSVTLNTVGSQTVTARDVTTPSIVGTSGPITVGSAVVTQFGVTAPAVAIQGSAFSFTVSALDASNNVVASYSGTVQFTSSDLAAALPGPVTLTNGVGTFNATLNTLGNQTLTATDTASSGITGSANLRVPVTLSIPTNLSAARGATVTVPININALNDPVDGTSGLSGADILIAFPDNAFSVNVATGIHLGTVPLSGSGWTVSGSLAPGVDPSFTVLTLNLSTVSTPITATDGGSLVTVDFQVKPLAPFGTHTIDILATTNGVPPSTTIFDQNFSPYTVLPAPDDAVGAINPGVDGTFTVVGVNQPPLANPDNYLITMRTLAGDPILNIAAPGVLSNDNDPDLESLTAVKVSDPVNGILAFNADGSFTYTPNVGFIGQDSFTYKAVDPNLAESAVTTVTLNMTPRLSIPTNLTATPGGTIVVPVNIDTPNPAGTGGLNGVILAINYDPLVLSVSATTGLGGDFQTGTITSGWNITPTVDAASGELGVTLSSGTPNTSTLGGSLVLITFDVLPGAPAGPTRINLMQQNTPLGIPVTTGLDTQSGQALPLRPAATNNDNDAFVDGVVTVVGATQFSVVAPANATAGGIFNFTVTALDSGNNTATGYNGTVQFTSSDLQAVLPGPVTLTAGVGTFQATLKTAGNQTIVATDSVVSSVTGTSNTITVSAAAATHFSVSAPGTATPNVPFNITVTARDAFENTATGYTGTVQFSSTDGAATLPSAATLTAGAGTFSVTLQTSGPQTVTATDTVTPGISGTSGTIVVSSAAAATHFSVTAGPSATAGASFNFTVTALDASNNPVTGYTGTVAITSSDLNAVLPPSATLTNGQGTFSITFKTAGGQTITATDTASASINGTSNTIAVNAAAAARFDVTGAPSNVTAGASFNLTVTARDQFNNLASGYTGTVHFTSTDGAAGLLSDTTLNSGQRTFSVSLKTAGNQTITATDTVTASINGTSGTVAVAAGAAAQFSVVGAPPSITAGNNVSFTVTALDAFNNTATSYSGTVHFTSNDTAATLPTDGTLTAGQGIFIATFETAGGRTLTATDTVTASINGTSNTITVNAAEATHLLVSAPASTPIGVSFNVTVTARDQFNNTATSYSGTVHFTSGDGSATLPADSTLTAGQGVFSVTLATNGSQTVTATDTATPSIAGSATINVAGAAATHFQVSAPASVQAGALFVFTVTALDASNNTAPGYNGIVHITSNDPLAAFSGDATLSNGVGFFAAVLKTAGTRTITATDSVSDGLTGVSNNITVTVGAMHHFAVVTPPSATTGVPFNFTVTAQDEFNNTFPTYSGTVQFSSSDPAAVLPANATLSGGTGNFSATIKTLGSQTLTATDTTTPSISGTSTLIAARGLTVTNVALTPTGFNAQFSKPFVTSGINIWDGLDTFGESDVVLTGPSPSTVAVRGSILIDPTSSSFTFVKTGTNSVGLLAAGSYTLTIRSANNAFKDDLGVLLDGNNDGVSGDDFVTTLTVGTIPTVVLSVPDFTRGPDSAYNIRVPHNTGAETQNITFNGTAIGSTFTLVFNGATTGAITYSTTQATLQNNIQNALNSLSSINNTRSLGTSVTATSSTSVNLVFGAMMGGFDQPQMTATSAGSTVTTGTTTQGVNTAIPITLTGATGVTALTFDLLYDPAILNITGTYSFATTAGPAGSTFTLVGTPSAGVATFQFNIGSASPLGATATLGHIIAQVPDSALASYKSKQLLELTNIVATGAASQPVGNPGVQVVAFFGDAGGLGSAQQTLNAALMSRVAVDFDSGFAAFPLADPTIIGDVNGSGNVDSPDVTALHRSIVGLFTPQLPYAPPGLPLPPSGPDPTLSVPADLHAAPGETLVVPISIDTTRPGNSTGLMGVVLALRYDPNVFSLQPSDIQLGSIPNSGLGWKLTTAVNERTGEIGIDLASATPIETRGGGTLVTLNLRVREDAAGSTALNIVPFVNPTGLREFRTMAADAAAPYVLYPVITDQFDVGSDGRVTLPAPLVLLSNPTQTLLPATQAWESFVGSSPVTLAADLVNSLDVALVSGKLMNIPSEAPIAALEQAFEEFHEDALKALQGAFGGLALAKGADPADLRTPNHADLPALWLDDELGQPLWLDEGDSSPLNKTSRRGRRSLTNHDETDQSGQANLDAVDAFFETRSGENLGE